MSFKDEDMSIEEAIKPKACPFCRARQGEAVTEYAGNDTYHAYVRCMACGARGPSKTASVVSLMKIQFRAVEAWDLAKRQ